MTLPHDRQVAAWLADDAHEAPPDSLARALAATRRARKRPRWTFPERWIPVRPTMFAKLGVTAVAVAAVGLVGLTLLRGPAAGPAAELGIFAPVSGRIVYSDESLWAIDPSAPSLPTKVHVGAEWDLPLGWSSDGTDLLLRRRVSSEPTGMVVGHLYILHADGTEIRLTSEAMGIWGATIAPDGSRVVFAATDAGTSRSTRPGLFVVDADGGAPVRIAVEGDSPTFSPDGTKIAYLVPGSNRTEVWVADPDGSDAHQILADEPALAEGGSELAWSPADDRIALGNGLEGSVAIYTFAPDGSGFAKVITNGINPSWSPDGSQIAYLRLGDPPTYGLVIADADGSNVREFGTGFPGPWHPGPIAEAEASASPLPSTSSTEAAP